MIFFQIVYIQYFDQQHLHFIINTLKLIYRCSPFSFASRSNPHSLCFVHGAQIQNIQSLRKIVRFETQRPWKSGVRFQDLHFLQVEHHCVAAGLLRIHNLSNKNPRGPAPIDGLGKRTRPIS